TLAVFALDHYGCWDVTYTSRRVCALVGSTVDISCTYSLPSGYTVYKTFWHYPSGGFKDLREEHQFAGRVEYVGNKLRIKELKISDSGDYRFSTAFSHYTVTLLVFLPQFLIIAALWMW
uniref:Immunoglobulin domain-containing protein n=1 Tax=Cyprinus carpio TaxID=7962 RepID=A0A8C1RFT4_CYPCA